MTVLDMKEKSQYNPTFLFLHLSFFSVGTDGKDNITGVVSPKSDFSFYDSPNKKYLDNEVWNGPILRPTFRKIASAVFGHISQGGY